YQCSWIGLLTFLHSRNPKSDLDIGVIEIEDHAEAINHHHVSKGMSSVEIESERGEQAQALEHHRVDPGAAPQTQEAEGDEQNQQGVQQEAAAFEDGGEMGANNLRRELPLWPQRRKKIQAQTRQRQRLQEQQ